MTDRGGSLSICVLVFSLIPAFPRGSRHRGNTSLVAKIRRLDLLSTFFLLVAISTFVLACRRFYALVILSAAALAMFVAIHIRRRGRPDASIPMHIIRQRSMIFASIFSLCMGGVFITMLYWISFWLQCVSAETALGAGIGTLPLVLGMFLSSVTIGAMPWRIGSCPPWMAASAILTSLGAGLSTTFQRETGIGSDKWIGTLLCFGLGMGAGIQLPSIVAQSVLDPKDVSIGVGLLQGFFSFGAGIFFAIGQTIFSHALHSGLGMTPSIAGLLEVASTVRHGIPENATQEYWDAVAVTRGSLMRAMYLTIPLSCVAIIPALGTEWRKVKGRKERSVVVESDGPPMMSRFG